MLRYVILSTALCCLLVSWLGLSMSLLIQSAPAEAGGVLVDYAYL